MLSKALSYVKSKINELKNFGVNLCANFSHRQHSTNRYHSWHDAKSQHDVALHSTKKHINSSADDFAIIDRISIKPCESSTGLRRFQNWNLEFLKFSLSWTRSPEGFAVLPVAYFVQNTTISSRGGWRWWQTNKVVTESN